MAACQLQGTPTSILDDRHGSLRRQYFGRVDDMVLGAEIMALVKDKLDLDSAQQLEKSIADDVSCDDSGCRVLGKISD